MPPLKELWSRVRGFFAGLFRKKPPEPGKYVADTKLSWRGFLVHAPLIPPQREYLAYVPANVGSPLGWRRHPLLVLLHGCKQPPEEVAAATRVVRLADDDDLLVLLPRQNPRANVLGCWNWFDATTAHGWGETAIVAAQIRAVRRSYRIDKKRVFVAGLSSGGALAAALGITRPDLVAGVFVHSGIACGAGRTTLKFTLLPSSSFLSRFTSGWGSKPCAARRAPPKASGLLPRMCTRNRRPAPRVVPSSED